MCPLYVGMQARITERVGRKLHMHKHTPCTIVGWDLHPADRMRTDAPERALQYQPHCIYIKFEGLSWEIHPGLGTGVFPLKAVKRDWVLNKATDSKVKRKGYTLLPDLACTAHIVQGANLDAAMTDCGDILETPPLKDMLAAYVSLSRIRTADVLLLLRTFSRHLFRHGPPPGPHCLMKLLRSRLSPNLADTYTCAEAVVEYQELVAEQNKKREDLKASALKWKCFDCQQFYSPEAYGATPSKHSDIYSILVSLQCLWCCASCREGK